MLRRPIVLLAVAAFIEISLILLFPHLFAVIASCVLAILLISICLLIKHRQYILIIPVAAVLIVSALHPYTAYINKEKSAEEFVSSQKDSGTEYTAVVTQCNMYSSYAQVFAKLTGVGGQEIKDSHKIRLGCYSRSKLEDGDTIVFTGTPLILSEIQEDGFDTSTYLRSKEVFIDVPGAVIVSSRAGKSPSVFQKLRDYTQKTIYTYMPTGTDNDTADVCFAMFAGSKDYLSGEIKEIFSECGLTHLLCVSGLHLAIFVGSFYMLLSTVSVHKNIRCILVVAVCVFYTLFTGVSLSTIRACIMCSLGFVGMIIGKKTDAYRSLFFSLLVIITVSPYSVFDISALLSFSATLGIISLSELCPVYSGNNRIMTALHSGTEMLFVNLGAVVFTLPLCAYFFSGISIISIISTLAVSFIAELLLMAIPMLILLSPLSGIGFLDTVITGLGQVCHFLCSAIIEAARFFASFRYACVTSAYSGVFICIFVILTVLLALSIAIDKKVFSRICVISIVIISMVFSVISLFITIRDDKIYNVTYYRKNEGDRQLCIKFEDKGYLIVNADSQLCTDYKDAPFDRKRGNNSLLIIPDDTIDVSVLSQNIKSFDERFGILNTYVPETADGALLADKLSDSGITTHFFPASIEKGNVTVTLKSSGTTLISVDDGETKTEVLFADNYSRDYFSKDCDICAYFTRKTKNQFDIESDTAPECDVFITRLGKDETFEGIINTFGEKSIIIKG